jgi:hypothetical protein
VNRFATLVFAIWCSLPAIAIGACPIPAHLTWSPNPTVEGDNLDIRVFQANAVFLNDGTIEFTAPTEILIKTASTSNFGAVPPIATQTKRVENIRAGKYSVTWSHIWTSGGPSANPCPSVFATIDVAEGVPQPGPAPQPVSALSRFGILVLIFTIIVITLIARPRTT